MSVPKNSWTAIRIVLGAILAVVMAGLTALPAAAVGEPPQAYPGDYMVETGGSVPVTLEGADPNGLPLTFAIATAPAHGTLGPIGAVQCDATCIAVVTYTATGPQDTSDQFTYTASNGSETSDPATITLAIIASAGAKITSTGPLNQIAISRDLNCSVNYAGDQHGAFYADTACGTFVYSGGVFYGPADVPAGPSTTTAFTPVSQTSSGSGTVANPYTIHTVVSAGSGLQVDQVDSYVVGQESYRTVTTVKNTTGGTVAAELYKAGDCYLQESDQGYGAHDASTGAVACVGIADAGGPGTRIEQFYPLSADSHWYESTYSSVWDALESGAPLPNLCEECANEVDNGAGLGWSLSLPAGGTAARSHLTTFSPLGTAPLSTTETADQASAAAGGNDGYTITIHNPNATAATVTGLTDTLPAGFGYAPGSTTGATTTNPTISGAQLTWSGSFNVAANTDLTLHFGVTVAGTPGTYYNNAGGTAAGGLVVVPTGDTAPVTVTAVVNQAPVAVDDSATAAEDTAKTIDVLANDTDVDGDTLSVSAHGAAAHGTVACTTTSCTYTPAANFNGPDSFAYTVDDGRGGTAVGTVSMTVTSVNDAPVAVDESASTTEDTGKIVDVLANDTDVDGDALSISTHGYAAHGTVVCTTTCTYTPAANFNGQDSFAYTVSDGHGGTDVGTVTMTVTPVNDDPTAMSDSATTTKDTNTAVAVLANDTDPDGDALTVTGHTDGAHGSVTCTTTCAYTPSAGFTGSDSFSYTVSDGHGGTATGTVSMIITGVGNVGVTNRSLGSRHVGNTGGLRLVVTNHGPTTSGAVVLTDRLPTGFRVRSVSGHGCSVRTGVLTCGLGTIPAGGSVTVTVQGAFTRAGWIVNLARITSTSDSNAADDTATSTTRVTGRSCTVVGSFRSDTLSGSRRNDVICGLAGNDRIKGAPGNDTLYGNEGSDWVDGGYGSDLVDGGSGRDTVSYLAIAHGVHVDLAHHRGSGQGRDSYLSLESVAGSRRADTLLGTSAANRLIGNGGADWLYGRGGNDRLEGGAGNDALFGGSGADRLLGGAGNDMLIGGSGRDTLFQGPGHGLFRP